MNKDLLNRLRPLAEAYLKRSDGVLIGDIAAGGSAAVYVAARRNLQFALKVYAPELLEGENAGAELRRIDLQRGLVGHSCRYLVELNQIVSDEQGCFIEMGYLPWSSLKDVVAAVPEAAVPALFDQLVESVRFLESKSIVHRDIKPENILVAPDFSELRLIDLGVARGADTRDDGDDATDQGLRRPFIATAQYSSPEYLFRLQSPSPKLWAALTFYQVGAVLHDLLIKRPLFDDAAKTDNKHIVSMAVLRQQPDVSRAAPQHLALAALAADCLVKDPDLRLRLVSWDRFVSPRLAGPARLRAVATQQTALLNARRALEHEAQLLLADRHAYLKNIEGRLRDELIALIGQIHKVAGYVEDGARICLTLRTPQTWSIEIVLSFSWDAAVEPRLGVVELLAGMNANPMMQGFHSTAVGQAHLQVPPDGICTAAIEKIGVIVGHATDLLTAGHLSAGKPGPVDLVAGSGLA